MASGFSLAKHLGGVTDALRSERLVMLMQSLVLFALAMERRDRGCNRDDKHDADEKRKHRQNREHDRSLL